MSMGREAAEAAIESELLAHWHLTGDGAGGAPHCQAIAHDVYNLLLRGGSDVQVERLLRGIEQNDLHRPELAEADLGPVLRSLRSLERTM